ncbi:phiSA1p31-related protein [Streptomyces chumphonensis]|uniref:phiSA1p31-related protein n=1 Tax=Streptomyces chumphonensis TaxID=1214925 RepID=UPI003D73CA7E
MSTHTPSRLTDPTLEHVDVLGITWTWTGKHTRTGVPLMQQTDPAPAHDCARPLAADLLVGPLVPRPARGLREPAEVPKPATVAVFVPLKEPEARPVPKPSPPRRWWLGWRKGGGER